MVTFVKSYIVTDRYTFLHEYSSTGSLLERQVQRVNLARNNHALSIVLNGRYAFSRAHAAGFIIIHLRDGIKFRSLSEDIYPLREWQPPAKTDT